MRAKEVVEEQVALHVRPVAQRSQHQIAFQPQFRRGRRRLPALVRLRIGAGNDAVRTLRDRFPKEKFEVAGLVAAERQPGEVIAFDIDVGAAQTFRKARAIVERRGEICQLRSRQGIEGLLKGLYCNRRLVLNCHGLLPSWAVCNRLDFMYSHSANLHMTVQSLVRAALAKYRISSRGVHIPTQADRTDRRVSEGSRHAKRSWMA